MHWQAKQVPCASPARSRALHKLLIRVWWSNQDCILCLLEQLTLVGLLLSTVRFVSIMVCIIAYECSGMEPACIILWKQSFPAGEAYHIARVVGKKRLQQLFEDTEDFLYPPGASFKEAARMEYARLTSRPQFWCQFDNWRQFLCERKFWCMERPSNTAFNWISPCIKVSFRMQKGAQVNCLWPH